MNNYNPGRKIYENDDLMYVISQFDSTHIENHKNKFINCINLISSSAHTYWYNRYHYELNNQIFYDPNKVLEYQREFFNTLFIYLKNHDNDLLNSIQNIYL
jgi:hypothetical protein